MSIQFVNKGGNGKYIVTDGIKFGGSIIFPTNIDTSNVVDMSSMFQSGDFSTIPQLDTSKVTNMQSMFSNCSQLTTIPQLDTSKVTNMQSMFIRCTQLTTIPQLNTSKVTNMQTMFSNCSQLTTVPQLDASSIVESMATNTYNKDIFLNCSSLSNESLNNILAMCITMKRAYSTHRTLKRIGITSEQATTCQSLSNYQAFLNAGWTTGY